MATVTMDSVSQIGQTSGIVWHTLCEEGSMSLAKLVKEVDLPRDLVMQAVGWLAREDKISLEEGSRGKMISLK